MRITLGQSYADTFTIQGRTKAKAPLAPSAGLVGIQAYIADSPELPVADPLVTMPAAEDAQVPGDYNVAADAPGLLAALASRAGEDLFFLLVGADFVYCERAEIRWPDPA